MKIIENMSSTLCLPILLYFDSLLLFVLFCFALLCFALLCFALLCFALLCFVLIPCLYHMYVFIW